MENKKCILITGVAGLLGSRMADWLLENQKKYQIIGIDSLFGGYLENIPNEVVFYQRDLAKDSITDIFDKHNIVYVYHFAAYAAEGLSPFMRKFNYQNNVVSTVNIVNECIMHDVKRLVYTSSMSVYGHGDGINIFDEEKTKPCPIDPYGISKYACEMDIRVAGEQHGLDWCIIRPHNVYGENQNIWDKYRNVLGIWMKKALDNDAMLIYGDGEQVRAFTYIGDILPCLWKAAILPEASKETINLGGMIPITINEACDLVQEVTNHHKCTHVEGRHEVKHAVPTYQKSIDILGFEHKTSLEEGLKKMWEWAKRQPKRPQYKWDNYEITKGLYSYWK